jgi:hypothetical protein
MTDYGAWRWELWRVRGIQGTPQLYAAVPEGCDQVDVTPDGTRMVCLNVRVESDVHLAIGFDPGRP